MDAYFDHYTQKLEIPLNKKHLCNRTQFKKMRRYYWTITHQIEQIMSSPPSVYSVKINITKVNLYRIRPFIYLSIQKCFYTPPYPIHISPLVHCIAETIIGLIKQKNYTGKQVEDYLLQCCANPLACRRNVLQIWNILLESSFRENGVADDIIQLERKVANKDQSVLDYVVACCAAIKYIDSDAVQNPALVQNKLDRRAVSRNSKQVRYGKRNIDGKLSNQVINKSLSHSPVKEQSVAITGTLCDTESTPTISTSNPSEGRKVDNVPNKIVHKRRRRSTFGRCGAEDRRKLLLQLTEMKNSYS